MSGSPHRPPDQPQPVSASESASLEGKLARLDELVRRMLRAVRVPNDCVDLTPTQLVVLSHLEFTPLRIGALAATMAAAQNTASEVVARLQRAGLVRKSRDTCDRRAVLVSITAKGRSMLARRRETTNELHRAVLAELSPEDRERFVEAFELLVQMTERARTHAAQSKHETRRKE